MQNQRFLSPEKVMPKITLLVLVLLHLSVGCNTQEPREQNPASKRTEIIKDSIPNLQNKHRLGYDLVDEKNLPKGVISVTSTDEYPSQTFHFHNEEGQEVKKIREDQFPNFNPIFNLKFPKNSQNDRLHYYLPLMTFDPKTGKEYHQVSVAEKLKIFDSLKRYGLRVDSPELASDIIGSPVSSNFLTTAPLEKYLIRCERASIYYKYAKEKVNSEGDVVSNSLLDCSHLSIYNHKGVVVQDIMIPNKLIKSAWISDDGMHIFCAYTLGYIWDEGPDELMGGFLVVDVPSKKITAVDIPSLREYSHSISGFFFEGHFLMGGGQNTFLYLNPTTRTYYIATLTKEQLRAEKSELHLSKPYKNLFMDVSKLESKHY